MWLSQQQMSDLYQTSRTNVVEHIKHIYEDGELAEEATCRKFRQVRLERQAIIRFKYLLLPQSKIAFGDCNGAMVE